MVKKNRQSKDFNEIWNIQTDMDVSQEKWDHIFHNWAEPWNCQQAKKIVGCTVCDYIKKTGKDTKGNSFILTIIGDIHAHLNQVNKLMLTNHSYAYIAVGDLDIYPDIKYATMDKKSYEKNKSVIDTVIHNYHNNKLKPLKKTLLSLKGNHDNFENLSDDIFKKLNIKYLDTTGVKTIGNINVAYVGGIYSPVKYNWDIRQLKARNKRFYTKSEIEDLLNYITKNKLTIDILITHEAASNILPKDKFNVDEGSNILYDVLITLNPKYYIHGHHHKKYTTKLNNTTIIGLSNFGKDINATININILTGELI